MGGGRLFCLPPGASHPLHPPLVQSILHRLHLQDPLSCCYMLRPAPKPHARHSYLKLPTLSTATIPHRPHCHPECIRHLPPPPTEHA